MNLSRHKWLFYAALGVFLLVVLTTSTLWLLSIVINPWIDNGLDRDSCHVIAIELAGSDHRSLPGPVPQSNVDTVSTQLIGASVIGGKLTASGPRAKSGSAFFALADDRGITCFTESENERKAQSVFVPWPPRPQEGVAPD